MAKEFIKKYLRMKPEVTEIYDELDQYREFCVDFGRVLDESELGNERSQNWIDYQRHQRGKFVRNHWDGPPREKKPWTGERKPYQGNNYRPNFNRAGGR